MFHRMSGKDEDTLTEVRRPAYAEDLRSAAHGSAFWEKFRDIAVMCRFDTANRRGRRDAAFYIRFHIRLFYVL